MNPSDETRLKLLTQNLHSFESKLATTANKDQVRRQIAATKKMIQEIKNG